MTTYAPRSKTTVRWFGWFGWYTENLEAWLEAQAARGQHLTKADRWLNRFHFIEGPPEQARFCVDFPGAVDDEYKTIFQDAGWELIANDLGWYVWRARYTGDVRPEAFNDLQPLIDRNTRILIVMGAVLAALLAQIPIQTALSKVTRPVLASPFGKVAVGAYVLLTGIVAAAAVLTYGQLSKLKNRVK